jgi:hypothetical protein
MKRVGTPSPLSLATKMTRREQTVLTRLRVGNATHNGGLFKTNRVETPNCQCGAEDSANHRIFECKQYNMHRTELLATLEKQRIEPNVYEMMKLSGRSETEVKEVIDMLLTYLNETNLISLFLWDPRDEEFGVEGYVHMNPMAKPWVKPQTD